MGKDKATLGFGGGCLMEGIYRRARTVFDNVLIISGHHYAIEGVDAPVVADVLPVQGPMVGIVSALMYAETPHVFVLACDMPFISEGSMRAVIEAWEGEDIVVPRVAAGFEPLHALYSKTCVSYMLNLIQHGRLKLPRLFPYLTVKVVENHPAFFAESHLPFFNVNTETELKKAMIIKRQLEGGN